MKAQDWLCVVSIVGMGGLGKTTLAKKVYNDSDVKQHFDCCAWVYISQQYVWEDVLYQILVQLEMDRSQRDKLLAEMLKDKLKERRYLVVLYDIWEIKAWDGIKNAFPKGKCGSKVLFTTWSKEVALRADPSSPLVEPPFLTFEESWELLQQKVFCRDAFDKHNAPPRLEQLGKDMVRKCGGLPLAIVTLGGLLRTRNSVLEWEEVQRDLNAHLNKIHLEQSYEEVNNILALRYHDLPYYLKSCFLYLGNFPEDREIPKRQLILQWIAEGLIVQTTMQSMHQEKETLGELAEQYLGELMDRCMIQVGRRNRSKNGVNTYRIHDLMRDFCLSKARDENFLELVQNRQMGTITSRQIAIHDSHIRLDRYQVKTHLRSLLYLNKDDLPYIPYLRSDSFILLRVLEISIHPSEFKMLKSVGTLIHLRYLGLFVECELDPRSESEMHTSPGNIKVDMFDTYVDTTVKCLKLTIQDGEEARAILESPIIRSGHLCSLGLFVDQESQNVIFQSLQSVSHCNRLHQLSLSGAIEDQSIGSCNHCLQPLPASLSKLTLEFSQIKTDPMPVLEKPPNLRHLRLLDNAYIGSEMVFSVHGFPKLETLQLHSLYSMKEWRIEKDAMPSLRRLTLVWLRLMMIPEGCQFLTTLTQLDISGMNEELKSRARVNEDGVEGEDFYKVCHIPSILYY